MALIGKSLAVASVGISCQTALQIEAHRALISKLAGEELEVHATPFDWLLCPVASAVKMIAGQEFYPLDVGELSSSKRPFWPRLGVHFWHERFDDPETFTAKGAHLCSSWRTIAESERRIFIVSNTQNNIAGALIEAEREPIECRLLWDDVFRLYAALARRFSQIELHAVTFQSDFLPKDQRKPVILPWADGRVPITLHTFARDPSKWEGSGAAWQGLFEKIIP